MIDLYKYSDTMFRVRCKRYELDAIGDKSAAINNLYDCGVDYPEILIALAEMDKNEKNSAHFGVNKRFIYTVNAELGA